MLIEDRIMTYFSNSTSVCTVDLLEVKCPVYKINYYLDVVPHKYKYLNYRSATIGPLQSCSLLYSNEKVDFIIFICQIRLVCSMDMLKVNLLFVIIESERLLKQEGLFREKYIFL